MASYLILIYEDEAAWAQADEATSREIHAAHGDFFAANGAAISGGNALAHTGSATTIRRDSSAGDFMVTDGAFVETKEALGGYYLIEAADLDEAIAIAKQVPARFGGVEIRPVRVIS
jgi:hypothetical protein